MLEKLWRLILGDRRDPRRVLADEFGVSVPTSGSPPREAVEWARLTLETAGVDASRDPLAAIRVLRRERDLGLKPIEYLVDQLGIGR